MPLSLYPRDFNRTLRHIITIIWLLLGRFEVHENVARYNRKPEMQDGGRQTGSKYVLP